MSESCFGVEQHFEPPAQLAVVSRPAHSFTVNCINVYLLYLPKYSFFIKGNSKGLNLRLANQNLF